jgi:hypothetical protein
VIGRRLHQRFSSFNAFFLVFLLSPAMNSRLSAALLTVSATVALPLLATAPASAFTVNVGSIDYDVTVFKGSYSINSALFQLPPAGKVPWWGSDTMAINFAEQVYDQLGEGPSVGYGPVFAYEHSGTDILGISQNLSNPSSQQDETIAENAEVIYAIATPLNSAPVSVPAPLPVFGAAAAFGWSRQIRKRIATVKG